MSNRYLLTSDQFLLLGKLEDWTVTEVPKSVWEKIPGLPRIKDTVAVMASGHVTPGLLNNIQAVVGIDVLAVETNRHQGESEGNAYHLVIQKISDPRYPYLMHGPFITQTIVPHWFEVEDLNRYFPPESAPPSSP